MLQPHFSCFQNGLICLLIASGCWDMDANARHVVAKSIGIPILLKNGQIFHVVPFLGHPDVPIRGGSGIWKYSHGYEYKLGCQFNLLEAQKTMFWAHMSKNDHMPQGFLILGIWAFSRYTAHLLHQFVNHLFIHLLSHLSWNLEWSFFMTRFN